MDSQTITTILAIIGVFVGSISLARQFWKERPIFTFEIKKAVWNPLADNYFAFHHRISIEVLLRNKGKQDTTIHRSNLVFEYKNKSHSIEETMSNEIIMLVGSAKSHTFNFDIHKDKIQIDSDIINAKLIIEHTYGSKEKTIPRITQYKLN